jgi:hypothetical protein
VTGSAAIRGMAAKTARLSRRSDTPSEALPYEHGDDREVASTADPTQIAGELTEPSTAATLGEGSQSGATVRSGTDKMSGRQGGGFGITFIARRIACQRLAA